VARMQQHLQQAIPNSDIVIVPRAASRKDGHGSLRDAEASRTKSSRSG
jgi:hypothetical protein